jgi:serine/threonine protein kinase
MAPEVLRGEAARMQSDVYSFGILLWEMTARQVQDPSLPSDMLPQTPNETYRFFRCRSMACQ